MRSERPASPLVAPYPRPFPPPERRQGCRRHLPPFRWGKAGMGAKGASAGMGAFILIAACTHKPDEVPPPPDTGASTPVVRIAGHQGDAATHPTPVAPDAGRTPVLAFCQDA